MEKAHGICGQLRSLIDCTAWHTDTRVPRQWRKFSIAAEKLSGKKQSNKKAKFIMVACPPSIAHCCDDDLVRVVINFVDFFQDRVTIAKEGIPDSFVQVGS